MPEEILQPVRLPVWKTVGSCYRALWNRQVAQMPFIWVIVALGVIEAWLTYKVSGPNDGIDTSQLASPDQSPFKNYIYPLELLSSVFLISLYVSWTRYILRGERPIGSYFSAAFWKFLFYLLIVWFLSTAIIVAIVMASILIYYRGIVPHISVNHSNSDNEFTLFIIFMLFAPHVFLYVIYLLKFVGISIDDKIMSFKKSWHLTKSNRLKIVCSTFIVMTPFFLIDFTLPIVGSLLHVDSINWEIMRGAVSGALSIYQTIAFATLTAITYRTLVGHHLHASPGNSTLPEAKE